MTGPIVRKSGSGMAAAHVAQARSESLEAMWHQFAVGDAIDGHACRVLEAPTTPEEMAGTHPTQFYTITTPDGEAPEVGALVVVDHAGDHPLPGLAGPVTLKVRRPFAGLQGVHDVVLAERVP